MSEAVAELVKKFNELNDEEQAMFFDQVEPMTPEDELQAQPWFDEFLAERLKQAEDPSKLGLLDDLYAEVLRKDQGRKR